MRETEVTTRLAREQIMANENQKAGPVREDAGVEGYINKPELARRLGKTVRTVDSWMANSWIPFYKVGRTVAFRWSEVDAHIQTHFRVGVRG